jgi:hypothetical protein
MFNTTQYKGAPLSLFLRKDFPQDSKGSQAGWPLLFIGITYKTYAMIILICGASLNVDIASAAMSNFPDICQTRFVS